MAVAPWIVSDALWERVEPLLPTKQRRFRYPGRKPLPDREALQGILFVLHTGIAWRQPQRRHPTDPADRPRPRGRRTARPAAPPARPRHRRPRLRPRQVPPPAPPARHQARNRPPPNRPRLRPRPLPLGRRTHLRLA